MAKYYSTAKSQHVQNEMNAGKSNKEAHRSWHKSDEKKQFNDAFDSETSNIDRSLESPMQDWADQEDDY